MFSGESFYESLFGDVQRSGNPDNWFFFFKFIYTFLYTYIHNTL
jgi:hypothetical protein